MRIRRQRWPAAVLGFLLLLLAWWWDGGLDWAEGPSTGAIVEGESGSENHSLLEAAAGQQSGVWLNGRGTVTRLLADDLQGDQHQRWIVEVAPGQTVLIAHNIDLAQRVPVAKGDVVSFRGRYEWNDRGGVVHWTHRDPRGNQPGGWVTHRGQKYR